MPNPKFKIDAVIAQLRFGGKVNDLQQTDIRNVCLLAREVLMSQPMLIKIGVPLIICGDLHGQFHDLLRIFEYGGHPPASNYIFLGDYVDRGDKSIETMALLLAYKVRYPENVFLLRGNHESELTNRSYGFYHECKLRYNVKLWKTFNDCFNCLPVAAIVNEKIFCCHGGISPDLKDMKQILEIQRPVDVPDEGILCDLLWSDPDPGIKGWSPNLERGVSVLYGPEAVAEFLKTHNFDLICRAHQVVTDGYEFFAQKKLITIFSASNYSGEMNSAGMMCVDKDMICTLHQLRPQSSTK